MSGFDQLAADGAASSSVCSVMAKKKAGSSPLAHSDFEAFWPRYVAASAFARSMPTSHSLHGLAFSPWRRMMMRDGAASAVALIAMARTAARVRRAGIEADLTMF